MKTRRNEQGDTASLWERLTGRAKHGHQGPDAPPDTGRPPAAPPPSGESHGQLILREEGGILRADDESLHAESLPVLNAFRQFLEAERRRARNRLIALSALFIGIVGILIAFGLRTMHSYWNRTHDELVQAQRRTETIRAVTQSNLHRVATATELLAADMERQKLTINRARAQIDAQMDDGSNRLERLKETLEALEIENAILANSIQNLRGGRDRPPPPAAAAPDISTAIPKPAPWPESVALPPRSPEPPTSAPRTSIPLSIVPSNGEGRVILRVPTPWIPPSE